MQFSRLKFIVNALENGRSPQRIYPQITPMIADFLYTVNRCFSAGILGGRHLGICENRRNLWMKMNSAACIAAQ